MGGWPSSELPDSRSCVRTMRRGDMFASTEGMRAPVHENGGPARDGVDPELAHVASSW